MPLLSIPERAARPLSLPGAGPSVISWDTSRGENLQVKLHCSPKLMEWLSQSKAMGFAPAMVGASNLAAQGVGTIISEVEHDGCLRFFVWPIDPDAYRKK